MKRVFITGMNAVTAVGNNLEENWQNILAGNSGIAPISSFDVSSWEYKLGGELKNFEAAKMLPDRKLLKVISRQDAIGINAATQAVENSKLIEYRNTLNDPEIFNEKTAIYVGSPGNKYYQQYDFLPLLAKTNDMQAFAENLFSEVHPMWLLKILPNNVLAYTGITYGFKGINQNVTNHAVSGIQALIEAYHAIRAGLAERAIVVAYDVGIEPQASYYYEKLGLLSARHLKPFDEEHDGTILAEGAAALILESESSIREREATCYAEITCGLSSTDGAGLFSIEDEAEYLSQLISRSLAANNLVANDFAFVVAHGNGNKKSDYTEARAILNNLNDVLVGAFKWATGHTICVSGLLDAILAAKSLQTNTLPGIANLKNLANDCANLNASANTRNLSNGNHALVIGRGFASMNTCIIIKSTNS